MFRCFSKGRKYRIETSGKRGSRQFSQVNHRKRVLSVNYRMKMQAANFSVAHNSAELCPSISAVLSRVLSSLFCAEADIKRDARGRIWGKKRNEALSPSIDFVQKAASEQWPLECPRVKTRAYVRDRVSLIISIIRLGQRALLSLPSPRVIKSSPGTRMSWREARFEKRPRRQIDN